jgi:hypothetical protein
MVTDCVANPVSRVCAGPILSYKFKNAAVAMMLFSFSSSEVPVSLGKRVRMIESGSGWGTAYLPLA